MGISTTLNKTLFNIFTKFVVALAILFIGFAIGKIIGKLVKKILAELEINALIKKATKKRIKIEEGIAHFTTYFIYFIAIIMSFRYIGLATGILNTLAIGVIVVIVISIFLSIKDFIPNFIGGLILHWKGFIKEGDIIRVKDMQGKIIYLNLLETRIKTKKGDIVCIPNSLIAKSEIIKIKK